MTLPRRAHVFLWAVVATGVAALPLWWHSWRGPLPAGQRDLALMALLGALAVVAVNFPLRVTSGLKKNVADAVYFADLLLFGAPAAIALVGVSQVVGGVVHTLRRGTGGRTPLTTVFNTGQYMATVAATAVVYYALLPHTVPAALDRAENLWAIPAAAVTFVAVNTGTVACMIALQRGGNPLRIWLAARRTDALHYLGLMPLAVVTAVASAHYPWAPLALALPAAMLQLSLERTLRMVRQAEELAKREAEAAALRDLDRMKDELISTISHELRTPLTVIHGYASRLRRRAHTFGADAVEQSAEHILASSTQLSRLVSDLLDYSRAARGQLEVESERFDLVALIQELVPGFQSRAGGRLKCELPDRLEAWGDRGRVGQVLANLVDNAAKYAPYGPIVVRAGTRDGVARVEVQDTGPGVPLAEQDRIWEKFFRGAQVTNHHLAQGSGIGLAVVKAIVEAQGGRVGVESAPGAGARFWFEVPVPVGVEEVRPTLRPSPAAPTLVPDAPQAAVAAGIARHIATA